ncbi:hypothetical protein PRO82_000697 [Candidatus Protochlamydia amoebophila]|nr:hypothetical protein [Candidatus Protochlamydia amoebophila]
MQFVAVCLSREVGAGLILSYAHSNIMTIHLDYIYSQIPLGKYAVIILWIKQDGIRVKS